MIALLLFMLVSSQVHASSLDEVFNDGVFGTKWNATLSEVENIFPNGKKDEVAGLMIYEIKDGRSIFGLDRNHSDFIKFHFNADHHLTAVSIELSSDYPVAESKVSSSLGLSPEDYSLTRQLL
jgi:hypothetical protein